jgi:uncharacterized membrane protein
MPADLAAVVILTMLTLGSVFVPVVRGTPLRIVFGLAFVLFLPGYAIIAALFPEEGSPPNEEMIDGGEDGDETEETATSDGLQLPQTDRGIDGIERVALSFGLSIAVVPLLGLVLNYTPWGIRLVPVAVSVAGVTILAAIIATLRRWELPPEQRFEVPYREWMGAARSELLEPDTRADAVLNVVLALSVLLAVSSVAYAVAVPPEGEQFTELYLLTEEDDGELVADNYPAEFVEGDGEPVIVGIGNNEHETVEYTVIVQIQEVETEGNETRVIERQQLDRFDATLNHNETVHQKHELEPTMTGEDLRVQYLLYRGDPPIEPTGDNAYRTVHLWIDVEESEVTTTAE